MITLAAALVNGRVVHCAGLPIDGGRIFQDV
jgi:hypothetical protein